MTTHCLAVAEGVSIGKWPTGD